MTRKHYIQIAEAISQIDVPEAKELVFTLIPIFKDDNKEFNAFEFVEACGFARIISKID